MSRNPIRPGRRFGLLIHTVALARCQQAREARQPFQRFAPADGEPLKRLERYPARLHRADAAVLVGRAQFRPWCGALLLLIALVHSTTSASTVERSLPATFTPGAPFSVTNTVSADPGVMVYAIQDTVPAGWTVANVSDDGTFTAASSTVEWGPFFDSLPRALSYQVTPPIEAAASAAFSGSGVFNLSEEVVITGQNATVPVPASLSAIVCAMPAIFVPGVPFGVTNAVTPGSHIGAYAVQDLLPPGWTATGISDEGAFDPATGTIRWGPFFDNRSRALAYTANPPANATTTVAFSGTGDFGGTDVPITGQRQTSPVIPSPGTAVRSLPSGFTAGQWFVVTCLVTPASNVTVFAVQDQPPSGWTVTSIKSDGTFDANHQLVEWGPFFTNGPITLSYTVLPPVDAAGTYAFSGSANFDNATVAIAGPSLVAVIPVFYGTVASSFPSNYLAGVAFTVTNLASPANKITAYAVEDTIPSGWTASNISDAGTFDAASGTVLWGPFFDEFQRSLTYQVTPSTSATGTANFNGQASFDGHTVLISGQRQSTAVAPFRGSVVCTLPASYSAGLGILAIDIATPATNTSAYAVQDTLPAGWTATNVDNGGNFDASDGTVYWGPFFDHANRSLSYTAVPPRLASGVAWFAGTAAFDTNLVAITGQRQSVPISPPSPKVVWIHAALTNGQFQLDFTNLTGQSVTLYATTNQALPLSRWQTLDAPQPLGGGLYRFLDSTTNRVQRFFQVR